MNTRILLFISFVCFSYELLSQTTKNNCKCDIDSILKMRVCDNVDSLPEIPLDSTLRKLSKEFYFNQSDIENYGLITKFIIAIIIGDDGIVKDVRLLQPHIIAIEDRFKRIFLNYKFEPARCNNEKVAYQFTIPYLVDYQ